MLYQRDEEMEIGVLDRLGICYGVLQGGEETMLLLTQEQFDKVVGEDPSILDQFPGMKAELVENGLLEDWDAVRELIMEFELEEREWAVDFVMCDCGGFPRHGYLVDLSSSERLFSNQTTNMFEGIPCVDTAMGEKFFDDLTGIHLLQQMLLAGISFNPKHFLEDVPEGMKKRLSELGFDFFPLDR